MSNQLKVGVIKKQKKSIENDQFIDVLVTDDDDKWFCSQTISSQLHGDLFRFRIFDSDKSILISVDNEYAQTPGVTIVNKETISILDSILQDYISQLLSIFSNESKSDKSPYKTYLSDEILGILRDLGALVTALDCIRYECEILDGYERVITVEL